MRTPLRRYYGRGDIHFVTFSCYHRRPYLKIPRARDCFVRVLDDVRVRWKFPLIGYVVMPEHVHLLMGEPREGDPSKVLQVLKQKVSHALRAAQSDPRSEQLSLECADHKAEAQQFWQRRFYDFNVWSTQKVREKLDYMHANPVKRKLVLHPKDWPWSSWSHYEKGENGLIAIDSIENESPKTKPTQ